MRLSSSLQDLPTYTEVIPRKFELAADRYHSKIKSLRALQREGAIASFSKEKSLSAFSSRKWIRTSILFSSFLLLFFIIVAFSLYYMNLSQSSTLKYYVVLDCGSTGTRVYVYQTSLIQRNSGKVLPFLLKSLPKGFQNKTVSQNGRAYRRMETEPGFHKLVRNESGLRAAINPLLKWAEKQIPNHAYQTTNLFLYATAGVRRLPPSDSQWLLDTAWAVLKNSSFLCHRERVKIITGMEEAYYGWLALNYGKGTLGLLPTKETFGSLDLGGSSLQVTFEVDKPAYDGTGVNLSLGAASHHLSAYSLPGYGLNDAFDKSVAYLLKRLVQTSKLDLMNDKIELGHPCLHAGYKVEYFCSQCSIANSKRRPSIGVQTPGNGNTGFSVVLFGAPKWTECSSLAGQTVSRSEWSELSPSTNCKLKPCALRDGLIEPRGKFYATSGFFVVFRFFNLSSDSSLDDVLQRGQQFCGKTWDAARRSVSPQPYIEQYCFRAPYIVSLLKDGLHIEDKNVFIGSGSITWTLGVALLDAGQAISKSIDLNFRILPLDLSASVFLLLFLMFILALFSALYCVYNNPLKSTWQSFYALLFRSTIVASSARAIPSLGLPRWMTMTSGDGKTKMPLSPTVTSSEQHSFSSEYGLNGREQSFQPLSFSHSISSGSLALLQFGRGNGPFRTPNRGQVLQSRRSQSREDLSCSSADAHFTKM